MGSKIINFSSAQREDEQNFMNILQIRTYFTMATELFLAKGIHVKCRDTTKPYLRSEIRRVPVPDEQVGWSTRWDDYAPPDYTSKSVEGKPWADPANPSSCKFNTPSDNGVIRTSFHGEYSLDAEGRPLNPFGRTGMRGRGVLGKWGPNHAADAIVSRKLADGQLQFVAIQRRDTGGMIDKNESASQAVVREFVEEALGGQENEKLDSFWKQGKQIYTGLVDDPRNTDNAWIETTCVNFHDTSGILDSIKLEAGDDAKTAQWTAVGKNLKLYASHEYLVYLFAKAHGIDLRN